MVTNNIWKWYRVDWINHHGTSKTDFYKARSMEEAMKKTQDNSDTPFSNTGSGKPRFINVKVSERKNEKERKEARI